MTRNFDQVPQPDAHAAKWEELRQRIKASARRHISTLNRPLNLDSSVRDIAEHAMKNIASVKDRLRKDPPTFSDEEILNRVKNSLGEMYSIWD